jgi:hypothetical protein
MRGGVDQDGSEQSLSDCVIACYGRARGLDPSVRFLVAAQALLPSLHPVPEFLIDDPQLGHAETEAGAALETAQARAALDQLHSGSLGPAGTPGIGIPSLGFWDMLAGVEGGSHETNCIFVRRRRNRNRHCCVDHALIVGTG